MIGSLTDEEATRLQSAFESGICGYVPSRSRSEYVRLIAFLLGLLQPVLLAVAVILAVIQERCANVRRHRPIYATRAQAGASRRQARLPSANGSRRRMQARSGCVIHVSWPSRLTEYRPWG